jgi:hypothetical protein
MVTHARAAFQRALFQRRAWAYFAVYGLMAAIVLYPIAIVTVPDLEDYHNHLARMYILGHYKESASLQHYYDVRWRPIPYLAMDAAFIPLTQFFDVYDAGRLYVGLCLLLPVLAVAALHFVVHRRLSLVPAAAFLLSYNLPLRWGLLNYVPVLCLAVIFFAGWIATTCRSRWLRLIVFACLTLVLYLGHVVAFGAYCLLVLCFEVFRAFRAGPEAWRTTMMDWLFAALQAAPAIILALTVSFRSAFVNPAITEYGTASDKFRAILSPVLFSVTNRDALICDIIVGIIALVVLAFGRLTGRLKLTSDIFSIFIVVGLVSICVPVWLFGVYTLDFKLPLLAAMLLLSAISTTDRAGVLFKSTALFFLIFMIAIRSALIGEEMQSADRQIAVLREVVRVMPKGMRMLSVDASPTELDGDLGSSRVSNHAPLVAVIDRDAFVPTLFTDIMTVSPKPAFRMLSTPNGLPYLKLPDLIGGFRASDPHVDVPGGLGGGRIYWLGWERNFDYVLVTHYGKGPKATELPEVLHLVAASNVADLYAVHKPTQAQDVP